MVDTQVDYLRCARTRWVDAATSLELLVDEVRLDVGVDGDVERDGYVFAFSAAFFVLGHINESERDNAGRVDGFLDM